MDLRRRFSIALLLLGAIASCDTAVPVKPAPPSFDTVGPLLTVSEGDTRTTYSLVDGTTWAHEKDEFRLLYDLPGTETLFVAGTDAKGRYVLLIGAMDGLPAGCRYALRYGGRDWGDSIESQGLLWAKSPTFVGLPGSQPEANSSYPDNAGFCLDDQARVESVYVLVPPSGLESGPGASVAVP